MVLLKEAPQRLEADVKSGWAVELGEVGEEELGFLQRLDKRFLHTGSATNRRQ